MSQSTSPRPGHSLAERSRKPVSRIFALAWIGAALFTVPLGFLTGWHLALVPAGILLLILAALGRIWCLLYIAGRKNRVLCVDGPYSLSRNPLYFFSFLGVLGFSLSIQNLLLGAVAALFFVAYYHLVIAGEETRLAGMFGADFEDYCARVPRFLPACRPPTRPPQIMVDPRPFERGLTEVFVFLLSIVAAGVLTYFHATGAWHTFALPF